jgi:hypothetical protein
MGVLAVCSVSARTQRHGTIERGEETLLSKGYSVQLLRGALRPPANLPLLWGRLALLALLLGGGLLSTPQLVGAAPPAQSAADRLVLAFYYSWFDEATWSYDQLSDLPAEPYVSRDRSVMGRQIEQAQRAGIDALVVAWYGPDGATNQTEPNLAALLDEAAARSFKIAVLFESDSPFMPGVEGVRGGLAHLLGVHANHPAYLRVDGRPVVFFWRPTLYSVDTWAAVRGQVDPAKAALWVSEGVDTSYLSVFDGHHLYSNTWNPPASLVATNQKFAARVAAMRSALGADRLWVATVMPGYNDVKIRPATGFATDREGGAYYERAWQAAIDSNPRWIVVNSFNEWPEGSYIEPSSAFGDRFLALTATWSARFKAGGSSGPEVQGTDEAVDEAVDEPTAIVQTALLNLRAGPAISQPLLGQVPGGTRLPIVGRSADGAWWQVTAAEGRVWVFGELVQPLGPLDQVPVAAAPTVESGFSITVGGQSFLLRQVQPAAP